MSIRVEPSDVLGGSVRRYQIHQEYDRVEYWDGPHRHYVRGYPEHRLWFELERPRRILMAGDRIPYFRLIVQEQMAYEFRRAIVLNVTADFPMGDYWTAQMEILAGEMTVAEWPPYEEKEMPL